MNRKLFVMTTLASLIVGGVAFAQQAQQQEAQPEVPERAVALLIPTQGNEVQGIVYFQSQNGAVRITGEIRGLEPGQHGFHIHEYGDLTDPQGQAAGDHFNPTGAPHGSPEDPQRHMGDLGNIEADQNGVAQINMTARDLKLHFVLGRALVVHGNPDDLKSQPSGNAGPRVALGVIGVAGPQGSNASGQQQQ